MKNLSFCLFFLLFSCKSPEKLNYSLNNSYNQLIIELPSLKLELERALRKSKINPLNCEFIPICHSNIDTIPSSIMFLNGTYVQHLEFLRMGSTKKFAVAWEIFDTINDIYYSYDQQKIYQSKYLIQKKQIEFLFKNEVNFAYTVGHLSGGVDAPMFCETVNGLFAYYYDSKKDTIEFLTINNLMEKHYEFIEKMPQNLIKLNKIKGKKTNQSNNKR